MNAAALMSEVRTGGGELILEAGRVKFRGPDALLTPRLLDDLTQHKAEIAEVLNQEILSREAQKAKTRAPGQTAMAEVLALVGAAAPLPHPKIVASLVQTGRTRREAYEAIALLQREGQIEHDLTVGYVLSAGG